MTPAAGSSTTHVWRFGYGSNIGLTTLRLKKNLNPIKYLAGTIDGYELHFIKGIPYVEPGWAGVREGSGSDASKLQLHGSAFCISLEEAEGLDRQEGGYDVKLCHFVSYDGQEVKDVGLYVPKNKQKSTAVTGASRTEDEINLPSLRYLRLLQNGAKEAPLSLEWQTHLNTLPYYITPPNIRSQTLSAIQDFQSDSQRYNNLWTSEQLSKYNGSSSSYPIHTSIMEYVISVPSTTWMFSPWKGHNVTRRNILQFRGLSLDTNDIRYDENGYRPLPNLKDCSDEEREYVMQNLDSILQRGGRIVGRLQEFMEDQLLESSSLLN
jgi:hypothetical protein